VSTDLVTQLLPVLVQIQARLDEDLALDRLARLAGLSRFHFLRQFRALTGETPKQYVLRLRIERAALRLVFLRSTVLDVALDCGFRNHETFTRAFRRRFGTSPRDYRTLHARVERPAAIAAEEAHQGCAISRTKVVELEELTVAFVRHVGPYEHVPGDLWDRLAPHGSGPPVLLGIVHDAPGITPPERCRFDAAIKVAGGWTRAARAGIGVQSIPGGTFAITTHVGPYRTLGEAYRTAFDRIARMKRFKPAGLPCLELYSATTIDPAHELNQTDLCVRLTPQLAQRSPRSASGS
jgi:AraC family transcriptional regulator